MNIYRIDDPETAKVDALEEFASSLYYRRKIDDAREALSQKIYDAVVGDFLLKHKVVGLDSLVNLKLSELLQVLIDEYKRVNKEPTHAVSN